MLSKLVPKLQHPKMPLWVVIGTLIADQATKLHFNFWYAIGETTPIIPGLFALTHRRNTGAAFSFLADTSWAIPFFIVVTIVAVIGLTWYLKKTTVEQVWLRLGLALILGGAFGNLIDRIWHGEVIDFILVHWQEHYWPAFNVADSAICVGVALMLIDLYIEERDKKRKESAQ